jgi:hypothetical protein
MVGRRMPAMVKNPTPAAEPHPVPTIRQVEPRARVPFIAAHRDHEEAKVDTAAGCEFLDDRIRLLE